MLPNSFVPFIEICMLSFQNCRSQSFDFQLSPMFTVDNEPTYKPETTFSFPGLPNDLKDITVDPYLKCDIFQVLQDEQRPSWV